ncbi:MAG: bis(5'-nucleosyl)-tetraphosphatase (symmetrical) YqeK [Elusimicrobium sp.]|jgi:nicotinate-nucleotide adenylyltransferase|nr:bis(5'-nucleosyl)-tetraphosphatase (symmetrical) YqeK [Elusimicrobium sp.]
MKILFYGGSFDPAHKGHAALLAAAVREIKPDAAHIIPAYHSPFKERSNTPFELRMEMAKNAFKNISARLIFDNFEYKRQRKTYTCEIIEHLQKIYDKPELFMLVGTDALNEIPSWKQPDFILKNATAVAGKRAGLAAKEKLPFKYRILKTRLPKVSSSQIRLEILVNGEADRTVGPSAGIITKHRLYFLNLHDWLKKNLKENRYLHTRSVAALSAQLAVINDAYPERAALSALLQDTGKSLPDKDLITYAKKCGIKPPFYDLILCHAPDLLHSYVSSHIAQTRFGITDELILNAVERHTLGAADMTVYDKVLYVADIASKDRKYKGAFTLRDLALKDLERAAMIAAGMKIIFTINEGKWLCPQGNITWNHLLKK